MAMLACLVDAVARSYCDDCTRDAKKKNLQNSVQCAEGNTGVICELGTEKRRSTAWRVERNMMWTKRRTTT